MVINQFDRGDWSRGVVRYDRLTEEGDPGEGSESGDGTRGGVIQGRGQVIEGGDPGEGSGDGGWSRGLWGTLS